MGSLLVWSSAVALMGDEALRGGEGGRAARGRTAQREESATWCGRVDAEERERADDVGKRRWLVVVEAEQADAQLVAVERVVALPRDLDGLEIEVRVGEPPFAGDEQDEEGEERDAERAMPAIPLQRGGGRRHRAHRSATCKARRFQEGAAAGFTVT